MEGMGSSYFTLWYSQYLQLYSTDSRMMVNDEIEMIWKKVFMPKQVTITLFVWRDWGESR